MVAQNEEAMKLFAPPRTAVLTQEQLALALQISVRQVQRMNLPAADLGKQTVRYVWGDVLDELKKRSK
jgi:hypothetical protein